MTLYELKNSIFFYIFLKYKQYIISNPEINLEYLAREIIARLFVLSFREIRPNSFAYNTVNAFNDKNHSELSQNVEAELMFLRRESKKLMTAHRNKVDTLPNKSAIPDTLKLESNRKGRYFDIPNLLLISQLNRESNQTLLSLIFNGRIESSKKISDMGIVEAYKEFDNDYKRAKEITDKRDYIFHWVNFHRLETDLSLTVIPQIAQHMLDNDNKDISEEILINIFGQNRYQILTYANYLDPSLNRASNYDISEICDIAETICFIEEETVSRYTRKCRDAFDSFFDGEECFVNDIYNFCRYEYPIIEMHNDSNLNLKNGEINHAKIKLIRKLIGVITAPNEIKKLFHKAP